MLRAIYAAADMSLKEVSSRRTSLDECTREYLEMGMDLTDKRKRYFSFHEKARNRIDCGDGGPMSSSTSGDLDQVDETDERSSSCDAETHTTSVGGGGGDDDATEAAKNQPNLNNYRETLKARLSDAAKAFADGHRLFGDIETAADVAAAASAVDRGPRQFKSLALLWACAVDRCDAVDALLDAAAAATASPADAADYALPFRGYGAVHASALNGCARCLRRLLGGGFAADESVDDMTAAHLATFADSADAVRALVDHGCRLEPTVLHAAVRSRAAACVRLLVSSSDRRYRVDANHADAAGLAPVHVCADQGYADCMRVLLGDGRTAAAAVMVDRRDGRGRTALHVACESGQSECAALLLDRGADVRAADAKLQTPLHAAARAQNVECIDLLVKAGADVNGRDADDRTPLHTAIAVKALNTTQAVDALLGHHARVNVQDRYGFAPLHVAALNEAPDCVESLLARGGNVGVHTYGGVSALNMIARKVPSCVPAVARQLDAAVSSSRADGWFERGPEIQLRFKYLLNYNTVGEIDLLQCFQKEGRYELLQHPLCQAFLFLKWRTIRKYYLMRLTSLGLFILLYTAYVMSALSHNCYNRTHVLAANRTAAADDGCRQTGTGLVYVCYALYAATVVEVFLKISEIAGYVYVHQYFFDLSNLSEWLVVVSVPCICASFHATGQTFYWQNHVGAFCVLGAWTNFMVKVGQLPWFDTYVAMYTKVQREFAKLLLAYVCLLIGFSASLCVVFPASPWFGNPAVGFVKVLVMMAGELDISILADHDKSPMASKLTAYVVYTALLVFVSIILMNLLVGIAVHDIQGLKKTAGLSKITCQIKLIYYIELFMLRSFWPKSVKRRALVYPSKTRAHMTVRPLNQEQTLPRDIIEAARALIKRRKQDCYNDTDTFKIQEILKEVRDLRSIVENNQKVIKHLLTNANKNAL